MPVCPQCKKRIHEGALKACPACAYSLEQANAIFQHDLLDFPRVLDEAGVFSRDERQELMCFLEKIEKRISPVALGVYVTDRGRRDEFPLHAHWMFNHLNINHAAFGQRGYKRAVEEGSVQMQLAAEQSPPPPLRKPNRLLSLLKESMAKLSSFYKRLNDNSLPDVEHEWMLILVFDVQLGRACFVWGYKLDVYVQPISLALCISSAHSLYRDKAMLKAIKKSMKKAVSLLSRSALNVHEQYKVYKENEVKEQLQAATDEAEEKGMNVVKDAVKGGLVLMLTLSLFFQQSLFAQQSPEPPPIIELEGLELEKIDEIQAVEVDEIQAVEVDEIQAVEVDDVQTKSPVIDSEHLECLSPAPVYPNDEGALASMEFFPRWSTEDIKNAATAERSLFAPEPPVSESVRSSEDSIDSQELVVEEMHDSDTVEEIVAEALPDDVLVLDPWQSPHAQTDESSLIDDDFLLSDTERNDLIQILLQSNANRLYRLYVSIANASGGELPTFSADAFLPLVAKVGEQALMLQYYKGSDIPIELSIQGFSLSPEQRDQWGQTINEAASYYSEDQDKLLSAVRTVSALLADQSTQMKRSGLDDTFYLAKSHLDLEEALSPNDAAHEVHGPAVQEMVMEGLSFFLPFIWIIISCALCIITYCIYYYRRSIRLIDMPSDYRLSSPHGAGISPCLRYKEKYHRKKLLKSIEEE